ncbi:hypothetical protein KR059_004146, partial [Drosophila kikkawai]
TEANLFPFQIMDLNGFDRGLEVEKVLTISKEPGKTLYWIKFKGQALPELIPNYVANLKIPGMLIEFYENHLKYDSPDEEKKVELQGKKKEKSVKRKARPSQK